MASWSKSPEAVAKRAEKGRLEVCHYSPAGQPPGDRRTACGRAYGSNSAMWLCSAPDKATCPRCRAKLAA